MSLKLEDVSFVYGAGTSSETKALNNVNLEINKGEFVAIIGHTGSGKSTLIQHFNGLEKATSGNVYYDGKNIADKGFDIRGLRCKVGLVFQYPEHQLFEESVIKDVCFGPLNLRTKPAISRVRIRFLTVSRAETSSPGSALAARLYLLADECSTA